MSGTTLTPDVFMDKLQKVGGPAYPCSLGEPNGPLIQYAGMTLRDYFAAQAMAGLYSKSSIQMQTDDQHLEADAELFYRIADAMLAERSKP